MLQDSSDSYLRREDSQKKNTDNSSFLKELSDPPALAALQNTSGTKLPPRDPKKAPVEPSTVPSAPAVDLYEAYQNDTKGLLQLYAYETDIEFLRETLQQLRLTIETGRSVQDIKQEISNRLSERVLK